MSQPQAWRNEALRVHLNYLRSLLRAVTIGEYDDCDPAQLDELEQLADHLKTAVEIARRAFRS